ncbi:sphingomyelin phosphodiesterase 4 [Hyposmocoma kahamanoa]|uniref:sphingomyelin phosphodiesterase 4 n=1 Tax=Hyposmocoma kahamanoa TaxID=1477025 RepID=UPI000E6D6A62|nr:sphingomyelin phosphodiesterase 4 [Hyposmocoma kahamanoa]
MKTVTELLRRNTSSNAMADDIMTRFYTCLNFRLEEKLAELTRIIDHSTPTKELQVLFPQLINNIFASSNGWNLKTVTCDNTRTNRYEFEALISFLEPQGPMFRLCYKLLSDPQYKYNLSLNVLPLDLRMSLERGRCPQFYSDLLVMDSQTMNVVALALNPFDYYIFNFALHLVNNAQQQSTWEHWNSAYFALACDYLMHFLPSDPNVSVLPHIPNYSGKVAMAAPLQTANRPLCSPSLLLIPDLCGMGNQHSSPQSQSRNEVWRSETVLQVFVDIWMSVEQFNARDVEVFQRSYQSMCSTPERVRTVRVLVKHIHSFSAKHQADTASRSSALRKYARQIMCARAYHYVRHLVTTWPLDASFRLVLELWLSLIQPWRYTNNTINQDRFPGYHHNQEESNVGALDASYTQFIAENFPSYTCIFQLVLPRFMRMELTAYKNAVMLFRLGKVFSQQHLVPILSNLEQAIKDNNFGLHHSPETSFNSSMHEQSYTYNGVPLHKWVAIAKQAITELNMSSTFEYEPIWGENKNYYGIEFLKKILEAKTSAENIVEEYSKKLSPKQKGTWASIKYWFMIGDTYEEELLLEEYKKVPTYLNASIRYFSSIFGLNEITLIPPDSVVGESLLENSSFANSTNFASSITQKLRTKPTKVSYMGDPDLMPITSYESTILVRIFYQIASKLNEIYREEFTNLWNREDYPGYVTREILERPCTIRTYVKDMANRQNIVTQELPPRLSLRKLGSHAFVIWVSLGYFFFKVFGFSGFFYTFILVVSWLIIVLTKSLLKYLNIMKA